MRQRPGACGRIVSVGPERSAIGAGATGRVAPRPRRRPNLLDRLVRIPIGFLWLGVLAILSVPVILYMTVLYHAVQGISGLIGRGGAARPGRFRT